MQNNTAEQKPASASQNKTGTEKSQKPRPAVSLVFPDGTIADMVYSPMMDEAEFAVALDGRVELCTELLVDREGRLVYSEKDAARTLVPSWELKDHIRNRLIYTPSGVLDYGTLPELFAEVRTLIKQYVVLEDERFFDVAAGYVLMTWVFDRFGTVPYLRVVGDLGTGKSRFLEVVGKLCNRVMMASGSISMAAVYRTLDQIQGTLVFDEADFKSSDMSDDIVKVLNGGHKKDTPVIRMEVVNDKFKTASFRVFGPKVLGSRRTFGDTALESRCITQRLFPQKKLSVPVHLPPSFEYDTQVLRNKLLMFRLKNFHEIHDDESSLGGLEFPRLRQTALALTSVMKMVGDEQLSSVLGFLVDYEMSLNDRISTDPLADVLLCIARLIETNGDVKKTGQLHMQTIAQAFSDRFYEDYTERETRKLDSREGPLVFPGQRVSARKIGSYVDNLGIAKARDCDGVYIPLRQEAHRINALVERYRLIPVLQQELEAEAARKRNYKGVPHRIENGSETEKKSSVDVTADIEDDDRPFA